MSITKTPELITRPAQWSIAIPIEASLKEWNKTIDAIPRLLEWIEANGVQPASPLFYRFRQMGDLDRQFSLELGFAVNERVEPNGEVIASEMEGGTYLTYLHQGHPDELFQVNDDVLKWADENGVTFDMTHSGDAEIWKGRYEFFLTNPEDEPDLNNWEIKLAWLIESQE